MTHPRTLILYNAPVLPPGHPDAESEADVLYSVKVVRDSLTAERIPTAEYAVTDDVAALVARLSAADFDVAFNLYEGTADRSVTEVYFTGLLEWLRVPYTGCPSHALAVARNKPLAKRVFAAAGVRTPEFVLLDAGDPVPNDPVGFPAIVKPAAEDASVGIDQGSVVQSAAELKARAAYVFDRYGGPVLVERYVAGREIQVSLVELDDTRGPLVLPLSEIDFRPSADAARWPVYTYTAKWDEASDEYKAAPVKATGVKVPAAVQRALTETVLATYKLLGCRGYARVDTRVTADGEVYVLELNPNPSISSVMIDAGLPAVGATYDQFIAAQVRIAAASAQAPAGSRRVRTLP